MLTELEVLKDVSERLERAGFEYMLTGSVAMNYYAEPRITRDLDIVVALNADDIPRLRAAFAEGYYLPEAEELRYAVRAPGMFNLVHLDAVVKVDIVVRKDEPYRRAGVRVAMKLRFDANQPFQVEAIEAVLGVFDGQPPAQSRRALRLDAPAGDLFSELWVQNRQALDDGALASPPPQAAYRSTATK